MLSLFRKLADTWPARIFFGALAIAFVGWGVSGKMNLSGMDPNNVATVDGHPVTAQDFETAFRQDMDRLAQRFPDPSQIPAPLRQEIGQQTLERLVTQAALTTQARRLGLVAPDSAVTKEISAMSAFQGMDGKFDHATYVQVLARNNLTPGTFQNLIRMDIAKNQILGTVSASAYPSDLLAGLVYDYLNEERTADLVSLTFASHAPPPAPADAVLQRYYANNLSLYTAPEYRHIHAVVLSPQTIGRGLPVSEADIQAAYKAHRDEFSSPEKRSVQVVTAGTRDVADRIAALWRGGASWAAVQQAAKTAGASSAALDETTKSGIPAPELADAAFGAAVNAVIGPVTEPLGFQVAKVTSVTPAVEPSAAEMHDKIRDKLAADKALDLIDARAQKLQDLFAGGSRIDEVPADLGAAGVEGTLDAQGNTQQGGRAPIPAPDNVRSLIIADAFKAQKGESPQLTEGPDHNWYAVSVDDIIKPAARPFAQVRAQVLADWQKEQVRHATEADAARLLAAVNGGQTILGAAWGTGLQVTRTPPLKRNHAAPGVPAELVQLIFTLKKGHATMTETNLGFMVATLADVIHPDARKDASGLQDVRSGLQRALSEDYVVSYATAVRDAAQPQINPKVFERLTAQAGGAQAGDE